MGSVCVNTWLGTDCYCRITYALYYTRCVFMTSRCTTSWETRRRRRWWRWRYGSGGAEEKPVTSTSNVLADRRRLGVEWRRSVGGMRERGAGNILASRPPRRLAHPNYWAPANCPTPGPVVPVYNAYALYVWYIMFLYIGKVGRSYDYPLARAVTPI